MGARKINDLSICAYFVTKRHAYAVWTSSAGYTSGKRKDIDTTLQQDERWRRGGKGRIKTGHLRASCNESAQEVVESLTLKQTIKWPPLILGALGF